MIAHIKGLIAEKLPPSSVIVDVHGVGYEIALTTFDFDSANLSLALADSSNSGFTGHGQPQQSSEPFMANNSP